MFCVIYEHFSLFRCFFCSVTILVICFCYILDVWEKRRTKVLKIVIILDILLILALCFIPSSNILIYLIK